MVHVVGYHGCGRFWGGWGRFGGRGLWNLGTRVLAGFGQLEGKSTRSSFEKPNYVTRK